MSSPRGITVPDADLKQFFVLDCSSWTQVQLNNGGK